YYLYNGAVPKRNLAVDWSGRYVDGSDPRTEWTDVHPLDELPQVLNPVSHYIQDCNTSPFTTTDDGNPYAPSFPPYMVGEANVENRRALVSRWRLRQMQDVTFEDWAKATTDATVYWAM